MTLDEYKNEIKELRERLEKLEAEKIEKPQPKRWKPKVNDKYYVTLTDGDIVGMHWDNDAEDNLRYLFGNCFQTKEEAVEYKKQIEYTARYKNYIEEHSEPIDWEGEQKKWYAEFDTEDGNIEVNCVYGYKVQGVIHASSEQIIKDAIKEIGEDNFKKYVLGVK